MIWDEPVLAADVQRYTDCPCGCTHEEHTYEAGDDGRGIITGCRKHARPLACRTHDQRNKAIYEATIRLMLKGLVA